MQKLFLGAQTNQMVILTAHENPLTTAFWAGHLPRGLQFHWSAVTEAKNKQIKNGKSFFLLTIWELLHVRLISTRHFANNAHQQFNVLQRYAGVHKDCSSFYKMRRLLLKSISIRSSPDTRWLLFFRLLCKCSLLYKKQFFEPHQHFATFK